MEIDAFALVALTIQANEAKGTPEFEKIDALRQQAVDKWIAQHASDKCPCCGRHRRKVKG